MTDNDLYVYNEGYKKGREFQRKEDFEMFEKMIEQIKLDLIKSKHKYGLDWCENLFIKHIDKIKEDLK
jgi:hypothetical protein